MRTHRVLMALGLVGLGLTTQGCAPLIWALSGLSSLVTVSSWVSQQAEKHHQEAAPSQAASAGPVPSVGRDQHAYRQGVRDTLDQLRAQGGLPVVAIPEPSRVYWVGPVMEEVWVPAKIVNGLFIPSHRQWVVVRPGYWEMPPLRPVAAHPPGPPPVGVRQGTY